MRVDDLRQKEVSVRLCLQTLDAHLTSLREIAVQTASALFAIQRQVFGNTIPSAARKSSTPNQAGSSRDDLDPGITQLGFLPCRTSCFDESKLATFTDYRTPNVFKYWASDSMSFDDGSGMLGHGISLCDKRGSISTDMPPTFVPTLFTSTEDQTGESDNTILENAATRPHATLKINEADKDSVDNFGNNAEGAFNSTAAPDDEGSTFPYAHHQTSFGNRPNFRGVKKPSLLVSPFTPIVTPNHTEYSSITDDIDTSCINYYSPQGTPCAQRKRRLSDNPKLTSRNEKNNNPRKMEHNDHLLKVEEIESRQMESMVHSLIRRLSLTESASFVNLAKQALDDIDSVGTGELASSESSQVISQSELNSGNSEEIDQEEPKNVSQVSGSPVSSKRLVIVSERLSAVSERVPFNGYETDSTNIEMVSITVPEINSSSEVNSTSQC